MSNVREQMRRILIAFTVLAALMSGGFMFMLTFGAVWSFKANPSGAYLFGLASLILAVVVPFGLERFIKIGSPWLFPALYSAPPLLFGAAALADPYAGLFWVLFGSVSIGLGLVGIRFVQRYQRKNTNAL